MLIASLTKPVVASLLILDYDATALYNLLTENTDQLVTKHNIAYMQIWHQKLTAKRETNKNK